MLKETSCQVGELVVSRICICSADECVRVIAASPPPRARPLPWNGHGGRNGEGQPDATSWIKVELKQLIRVGPQCDGEVEIRL